MGLPPLPSSTNYRSLSLGFDGIRMLSPGEEAVLSMDWYVPRCAGHARHADELLPSWEEDERLRTFWPENLDLAEPDGFEILARSDHGHGLRRVQPAKIKIRRTGDGPARAALSLHGYVTGGDFEIMPAVWFGGIASEERLTTRMAPGEARVFSAKQPQMIAMRPDQFTIDDACAPHFGVRDIAIGNKSQLVATMQDEDGRWMGSLPGVVFDQIAGSRLRMDALLPHEMASIHVINTSDRERVFLARLSGSPLR